MKIQNRSGVENDDGVFFIAAGWYVEFFVIKYRNEITELLADKKIKS